MYGEPTSQSQQPAWCGTRSLNVLTTTAPANGLAAMCRAGRVVCSVSWTGECSKMTVIARAGCKLEQLTTQDDSCEHFFAVWKISSSPTLPSVPRHSLQAYYCRDRTRWPFSNRIQKSQTIDIISPNKTRRFHGLELWKPVM